MMFHVEFLIQEGAFREQEAQVEWFEREVFSVSVLDLVMGEPLLRTNTMATNKISTFIFLGPSTTHRRIVWHSLARWRRGCLSKRRGSWCRRGNMERSS